MVQGVSGDYNNKAPSAPRENYSLLIMGDNNGDEDGSRVDGDGSGGNSPSRQGAEIETSVPQTLSTAAALRNFIWENAYLFRIFRQRLYIGGGAISESTRGAIPGAGAAKGGPAPPGGVDTSWPSSVSDLDSVSCQKK
jgi:hypothetical protein